MTARVVLLKPYHLEVFREEPSKPWDTCIGGYAKRRDAERAMLAAAQPAREGGE